MMTNRLNNNRTNRLAQSTSSHGQTQSDNAAHLCNDKISFAAAPVEKRPSIASLTCIAHTPIISIVAWSGSGKTTLFEQVVKSLSARGIAVGIIKHHGHDKSLDREGKDSWRYAEAGAARVAVASEQQWALFTATPNREVSVVELARQIAPDVDLILTEGYKHEPLAKIEFCRSAHRPDPVCEYSDLIALITDDQQRLCQARACQLPIFDLHDVDGIATFLVQVVQCAALRAAVPGMETDSRHD